ncbi:MAG: YbhB/YbcL family Raf kinase inhibitor-like protein [Spirochaetota bacterium]|nr:YbhB/YbcL family Raf kinase inhibitor-like protein [Spirochaetota bacterium]
MRKFKCDFFVLALVLGFLFIVSTYLSANNNFKLRSDSFTNKSNIPTKYAYTYVSGSKNISISLKWFSKPIGTKSFAIIMWDKHPVAESWVHWLVIDIADNISNIEEGASNSEKMPRNSIELINSFGDKGYGGPGPPRGSGKHIYVITIYALNVKRLNLSGEISKKDFLSAIAGKVLKESSIIGYYER